jgi:beta-glucosidase
MTDLRFPDHFLFGSATAAHQTEGNNTNSDWWDFERQPANRVHEPSGDACDSYHRYPEDIALVSNFGLNAYRFSIEWARIEPAEGYFSNAELAHYRRMLEACIAAGITPVVTFHHFTLPRWLGAQGGFLSPRFVELFERYCDRAAQALGDLLPWVCTINEPEGAGDAGWVVGVHPPGVVGDTESMWKVADNVLRAHHAAVKVIRRHSEAKIGVTLALQDMQYEDGAEPGHTPWEDNARVSESFLQSTDGDDFVGLQTYTRIVFGPDGMRGPGLQPDKKNEQAETDSTTMTGWEIYPNAIEGTVRKVHHLVPGLPILLTENGIATEVDEKRKFFIDGALRATQRCLADGIDIRGYIYWSLLDNYEWSAGYVPKFGLCSVDLTTFERTPKPSGFYLGEVARTRSLPAEPLTWPR